MTQEITRYAASSLDEKWRYAEYIGTAGQLVPKGLWEGTAPSPGKILMVMEHATMLGLHPLTGVNDINIIDGKVSLPPALMSALVRKAGHVIRVTTKGAVEGGDFAATAKLIRSDDEDEPFEATWTPQRGQRAGLCSYVRGEDGVWFVTARSREGKALPWQSYTEAMCKARAISEVCMEGATDVMMGSVYTPEELGALVDDAGVIEQVRDEPAVMAQSAPAAAVQSEPATAQSAQAATKPRPAARVADKPAESAVADPGSNWAQVVAAIESSEHARKVYSEARAAGALSTVITIDEIDIEVGQAIIARGAALLDIETKAAKSAKTADQPVEGEIIDAEIVGDGAIPGQMTIDDMVEGGEQ